MTTGLTFETDHHQFTYQIIQIPPINCNNAGQSIPSWVFPMNWFYISMSNMIKRHINVPIRWNIVMKVAEITTLLPLGNYIDVPIGRNMVAGNAKVNQLMNWPHIRTQVWRNDRIYCKYIAHLLSNFNLRQIRRVWSMVYRKHDGIWAERKRYHSNWPVHFNASHMYDRCWHSTFQQGLKDDLNYRTIEISQLFFLLS